MKRKVQLMPNQTTNKNARGTRPRSNRIEVWVTKDEKSELANRATQGSLSLSSYLRTAGMNCSIRSVADLDAIADLVRVNGNLGRVAGLLKLWLAEKRGQGARPVDVEALMNAFRKHQKEVRDIMVRLAR
ncbi:MAG: conjugal transfer protein TraJ [Gammaproteobacteria bacterium]